MRSDRERKRETGFKICVADKLLPVKIMFEEVGFIRLVFKTMREGL